MNRPYPFPRAIAIGSLSFLSFFTSLCDGAVTVEVVSEDSNHTFFSDKPISVGVEGSKPIREVSLFRDDMWVGQDAAAPFTFDLGLLGEGTHSLSAEVLYVDGSSEVHSQDISVASVFSRTWERHTIDSGLNGGDGVRPVDIDGDGDQDLVVGYEQSGTVRIYLNPGTELVKQPWPLIDFPGIAPDVEDVFFADMDGDGFYDLVVSTEGNTRELFILWSPQSLSEITNASLWTKMVIPAASGQEWMFGQAVNLDGINGLDIIAGSKYQNASVSWFEAPANPRNASGWQAHRMTNAAWIMSLVPKDMDGDGDPDFLISDRRTGGDGQGARWLENPGAGAPEQILPWTSHYIAGVGEEVVFLTSLDYDGDGLEDIAIPILDSSQHPNPWILAKRQDPSGTLWILERNSFPDESVIPGGTADGKALQAVDIDGDGIEDLAASFGKAYAPKQGMIWLRHESQSAGASWEAFPIAGPEGNKYDIIQTIDLDGDGDLDLISTEEDENLSNFGLGTIWYENPANRPSGNDGESIAFNSPQDLNRFSIEQKPGGTTQVVNGEMVISGNPGATVWYREKLTAPYVIEYQVRSDSSQRVADIQCFWNALDPHHSGTLIDNLGGRDGDLPDYDNLRLYYAGMGVMENTTTQFRRYSGDGSRPLLPEHDRDTFLLAGDQIYTVQIIVEENRSRFIANGKLLFDIEDPEAFSEGFFGFRTEDTTMVVDHFSVRPYLPGPDAFWSQKKNFPIAFSEEPYSSEGSVYWQTFDLNTGTGDVVDSPPQQYHAIPLGDSTGDFSAGLQLSISTAGNTAAYQSISKLTEVDWSNNPFDWFNPLIPAQAETFSIPGKSAPWAFQIGGLNPSDKLAMELVIGRGGTGDRAVTLSLDGYGTILPDAPVGLNGGPQYVQTPLMSGNNAYTLVLEASGTGWGALPNAMRLIHWEDLSFSQKWRESYFAQTGNSGMAADDADFDGDGLPNLLERAMGTNPLVASSYAHPRLETRFDGNGQAMVFFAYPRLKGGQSLTNSVYQFRDTTYEIEVCLDWDNRIWVAAPGYLQEAWTQPLSKDLEWAGFQVQTGLSGISPLIFRLKVMESVP